MKAVQELMRMGTLTDTQGEESTCHTAIVKLKIQSIAQLDLRNKDYVDRTTNTNHWPDYNTFMTSKAAPNETMGKDQLDHSKYYVTFGF